MAPNTFLQCGKRFHLARYCSTMSGGVMLLQYARNCPTASSNTKYAFWYPSCSRPLLTGLLTNAQETFLAVAGVAGSFDI